MDVAAFGIGVTNSVTFLREKVEYLIRLLGGVHASIASIKRELEFMKSFLKDMDAESEGERTLVRQVVDVICDIEDVLDESRQYIRQSHGSGVAGFVRKHAHSIKYLCCRRRIATRIETIKAEIKELERRRNMYVSSNRGGTSSRDSRGRLQDRHIAPLYAEAVVGLDEPQTTLVGWLVSEETRLKVISVVGMAGVGKTTLVRKVYNSVKDDFDCHAWVPVSGSFEGEELLVSMITRIFEQTNEPLPRRIDKLEMDRLIEKARSFLQGKRYVVVFDDIWAKTIWESINFALPNDNRGSRILVTTQRHDIGRELSDHVFHLEPLSPPHDWHLFAGKAFRPDGVCPPELENLSQNIVDLCGGLPLALETIGGLMSRKEKTVPEWRTLHESFSLGLARHNIGVLSLSYDDLPQHLRNCLLYFSIFPKNYPVTPNTLVRLWMAEGFIMKEDGRTVEEVAGGYLEALIDRSMVQVAERYDYGRVRSYKVHNLIHEIIVMKAREENFSACLTRDSSGIDETIQRLSIHGIRDGVLQDTSFSHLRAFFILAPMSECYLRKFFSGFRSLRVLNLDGAPIERFPIKSGNLLHLRYLSLRNTRVNKLSKSLGNLKYLQTLDLKGTSVSKLPKQILKLKSLHHLIAYHYQTGSELPKYYTYGVKVPKGIGSLKELQKLSYLEAGQDSDVVKELGSLTQLRRLGIVKLGAEDGSHLCASVEKMTRLLSFSVTSINNEPLRLQSLSSAPTSLERLYLRGPLRTLPPWVASLQCLARMRLRDSQLREDSLEILQALPSLAELALIRAFEGNELRCEGGFRRLKILDLEQLDNLNSVHINGAMPNLNKMIIRNCARLGTVPSGIRRLECLAELLLIDMEEQFVGKIRRNGGSDRVEVEHIQTILSLRNGAREML